MVDDMRKRKQKKKYVKKEKWLAIFFCLILQNEKPQLVNHLFQNTVFNEYRIQLISEYITTELTDKKYA